MIDITLQAAGIAIAAIIFWRSESVLNLMGRDCLLLVRLAFWLMVVGTVSLAVAIVRGYVPPPEILVTLSGVGLLLVTERRMNSLLRKRNSIKQNRRAR